MIFEDRDEGARLLLKALLAYRGKNPLVLGIPRGAVPMAKIIADGLEGELGIVLVHKIPYPGNEEFAIGSIGLSGNIELMPFTPSFSIPESYIQSAAAEQLQRLKKRQEYYGLPTPNYKDRIVILVDDGIATGATTLSAIHEIKSQRPQKIVLAACVSAFDTLQRLQHEVDDVVVLHAPKAFYAVGQFFKRFDQVSDEEVIAILKDSLKK